MTPARSSENQTPSQGKNIFLSHWLNVRRKRFWAISLVLLYTLLGFFAAPRLIKSNLIDFIQQDLGRTARVQQIEVNPFVLSLRIQGFELDDKDGVLLASFETFFVNFQLSSLFRRAWTFEAISLLEPFFLVERLNVTDSRHGHLLDDFASLAAADPVEETPAETETGMPRLLIHDLSITRGHVDLRDHVPGTPVETQLSPINISIQSLNTLPDKHGKQSVTIQLPDNASLTWSGNLALAPLDSRGEMTLKGLHLDPAIAYLRSEMPLESIAATFSARLNYHVFMELGGLPQIAIDDMTLDLEEVSMSGLEPTTEFIRFDSLSLAGGEFHYPAQSLSFSTLTLDRPHLVASLKPNGDLDLMDLVPSSSTSGPDNEAEPASDTGDWQIAIGEIKVINGSTSLSDLGVEPAARIDIDTVDFSLTGFDNLDNTIMTLQVGGKPAPGGSFTIDGDLSLLPDMLVNTHINTTGIPLSLGQPYASQFAHIQLDDGVFNSDVELKLNADQNVTASGSASIPAMNVINTLDQDTLLGWKSLDIDEFAFDLDNRTADFSMLTFEEVFASFVMDENQTTNIERILIEQPATDDTKAAKPLDFTIGRILIKNSAMDFSDLSLPLPFATHMVKLEGNISTIDSASEIPADIKLEGQVDEYGLARINGSMDVLDPVRHTDMELEFRNLMMSNLSPYSVQFAGREIDEGKLDLDLGYKIDQGQLNGENDIVLRELVLGQKVEHPDASSLPLGLAVSLLKDADGVIKVDLPVEGDINDPEFRIGGVVWQAISSLIGKIVSSPFRLLGNLIGVESEDLGQFEFLAGRADLTPPELEKITQLKEALQQRPELVIEIGGVVEPGIDSVALKKIKLIRIARQRLGEEFSAEDEASMMLDEEIRTLVEQMFSERFPDVNREDIKVQHMTPPANDPEAAAVLDELAYATDLWNRMLEAEPVSEQELIDLAQARARVISDAFLASGEFSADRIVMTAPQEMESGDDQWVVLELGVGSK